MLASVGRRLLLCTIHPVTMQILIHPCHHAHSFDAELQATEKAIDFANASEASRETSVHANHDSSD
jgi:hypothetical protein